MTKKTKSSEFSTKQSWCSMAELVMKIPRAVTKPSVMGYWWWLPLCFLESFEDPRYWTVVKADKDTEKLGLFVGPLKCPAVKKEKAVKQ
jgi:hypothetical protein